MPVEVWCWLTQGCVANRGMTVKLSSYEIHAFRKVVDEFRTCAPSLKQWTVWRQQDKIRSSTSEFAAARFAIIWRRGKRLLCSSFRTTTMLEDSLSDSPFKHLLKNNYALSDSDAVRLRRLIEQPVAQLEALDREVEELEQRLENRLAQRLLLGATFEKHKALLHPIRKLPKPVLQRILVFCLPPHPHVPALDRKAAPLTLTRVCRKWREVALDTPRLWQGLHVVLQPGTRRFIEFHMTMVHRWLSAAKELPLTVSLWSKHDNESTEFWLDIFKDKILSHSITIRELRLEVSVPLLELFGTSLPPSSWATLEKVVLKGHSQRETARFPDQQSVSSLAIWRAPKLKCVEWISVDADILDAGFPWRQMEDIRVVRNPTFQHRGGGPRVEFHPEEARALVQSTPNLRNLQLSLSESRRFTAGRFPKYTPDLKTLVVLPHLTTLDLTDVYLKHPVVFLEGLQLPALTTLRYDLKTAFTEFRQHSTLEAPPASQDHPFMKFLSSQSSPVMLKKLEVNANSFTVQGLIACLAMMPLLERLWVMDCFWAPQEQRLSSTDKRLLDALLPQATTSKGELPQCLCPRLEAFRISSIECNPEDVEAFVDARLMYAKEQSAISSPPIPSLNDIYMGITLRSRIEGRPNLKERKDELERALRARGVRALIDIREQNVPYIPHCIVDKLDPFAGCEREISYDPLEQGWM